MALTFETMMQRVLAHEGGYSNHPDDKGGATNWGITQATARANGFTGDMRFLPRETAVEIYRKTFWLRFKCDQLPSALAYQYFDACVNHGYANAAKMLQRACGVAVDGIVGAQTLQAAQTQPKRDLVLKFLSERAKFYTNLGTFATFGKGWVRRIAENMVFAAQDLAEDL